MKVLVNDAAVNVEVITTGFSFPSFRLVARYGETVVETTHTLAPDDGPIGTLEPDHVQKTIERHSQRAAEHAVLREQLRLQLRDAIKS